MLLFCGKNLILNLHKIHEETMLYFTWRVYPLFCQKDMTEHRFRKQEADKGDL